MQKEGLSMQEVVLCFFCLSFYFLLTFLSHDKVWYPYKQNKVYFKFTNNYNYIHWVDDVK